MYSIGVPRYLCLVYPLPNIFISYIYVSPFYYGFTVTTDINRIIMQAAKRMNQNIIVKRRPNIHNTCLIRIRDKLNFKYPPLHSIKIPLSHFSNFLKLGWTAIVTVSSAYWSILGYFTTKAIDITYTECRNKPILDFCGTQVASHFD